jgi:predicted acetyltransferase
VVFGKAFNQVTIQLIRPTLDALPSYRDALKRGWSPDTTSDAAIGRELAAIEEDPDAFVALMEDLEAKGAPVILPDGTEVRRLPGFRRWLWDGDFAGSFSFRFDPAQGEALPPTCLGHIGYAVPAWKRGRGYATQGLALLLAELRGLPLKFVTITTALDNIASHKVIVANGGRLVERFVAEPAYGADEHLRWRIDLQR